MRSRTCYTSGGWGRSACSQNHCRKETLFRAGSHAASHRHSTARDIMSVYPHIQPASSRSFHWALRHPFFERPQSSLPTTRNLSSCTSAAGGDTENFMRLLKAYEQSGVARAFDLQVISPDGTAFSSEETDCIRLIFGSKAACICGTLFEAELRAAYASAVALVYPSEYEGFGLPILEAIATGTLVATSSTSSMPEVGSDIAFYFDPYKSEAIAQTFLRQITACQQERQQRIAQGSARARAFTWERSATEVHRRTGRTAPAEPLNSRD